MIFSEPKRDIHVVKKFFATISAVMSVSGTASKNDRLMSSNIEIHVRVEVVQLNPSERSQKERPGSGVSPELSDCVMTFDRWQ